MEGSLTRPPSTGADYRIHYGIRTAPKPDYRVHSGPKDRPAADHRVYLAESGRTTVYISQPNPDYRVHLTRHDRTAMYICRGTAPSAARCIPHAKKCPGDKLLNCAIAQIVRYYCRIESRMRRGSGPHQTMPTEIYVTKSVKADLQNEGLWESSLDMARRLGMRIVVVDPSEVGEDCITICADTRCRAAKRRVRVCRLRTGDHALVLPVRCQVRLRPLRVGPESCDCREVGRTESRPKGQLDRKKGDLKS